MKELIYKEDAMKAICSICGFTECSYEKANTEQSNFLCSDITAIKNVPSIQRWTSLDKEQPPLDEEILVTIWGDRLEMGYFWLDERTDSLCFSTNDYNMDEEDIKEDISAWMPLPKPYRGESE